MTDPVARILAARAAVRWVRFERVWFHIGRAYLEGMFGPWSRR